MEDLLEVPDTLESMVSEAVTQFIVVAVPLPKEGNAVPKSSVLCQILRESVLFDFFWWVAVLCFFLSFPTVSVVFFSLLVVCPSSGTFHEDTIWCESHRPAGRHLALRGPRVSV